MKKSIIYLAALLFALNAHCAFAQNIKPLSDEFKKSVIYQIMLSSFTQEGTFKKAAEMLPYVKSLGVDIVYVCPFVEHDDDMNRDFWSARQKAARTNNPKNPYRQKDYFKVDALYGNSDDVKKFVETAHSLNLKVIFDLVYYHCGPKANLINENPDFVLRNPDGSIKIGEWKFPMLDFKNPKLREYLIGNMEHFIKTYNVDGFRTDVGAMIPADFWEQAFDRVSKLNPNLIMIEESERPSAVKRVYDATYEVGWQRKTIEVFHEKKPAKILRERWEKTAAAYPAGARVLRAMENHDFANGPFRKRCEIRFGYRGMDAVMIMNFTLDGIPFIYSGNEFADDAPMTIFSNREKGRYFVEWANIHTEQGKRRLELVKKLVALRHDNPVFFDGETKWLDTGNPDEILAYSRTSKEGSALVLINVSDRQIKTETNFDSRSARELFNFGAKWKSAGASTVAELAPKGYLVLEKR